MPSVLDIDLPKASGAGLAKLVSNAFERLSARFSISSIVCSIRERIYEASVNSASALVEQALNVRSAAECRRGREAKSELVLSSGSALVMLGLEPSDPYFSDENMRKRLDDRMSHLLKSAKCEVVHHLKLENASALAALPISEDSSISCMLFEGNTNVGTARWRMNVVEEENAFYPRTLLGRTMQLDCLIYDDEMFASAPALDDIACDDARENRLNGDNGEIERETAYFREIMERFLEMRPLRMARFDENEESEEWCYPVFYDSYGTMLDVIADAKGMKIVNRAGAERMLERVVLALKTGFDIRLYQEGIMLPLLGFITELPEFNELTTDIAPLKLCVDTRRTFFDVVVKCIEAEGMGKREMAQKKWHA